MTDNAGENLTLPDRSLFIYRHSDLCRCKFCVPTLTLSESVLVMITDLRRNADAIMEDPIIGSYWRGYARGLQMAADTIQANLAPTLPSRKQSDESAPGAADTPPAPQHGTNERRTDDE